MLLTSLTKLRFSLLFCASLMLAAGITPAAASDTGQTKIRIAVEGAFPPFNYMDSHNQLQGFDVDIAKALCEAAKADCEFVMQEWNGMIPNLLAGRYDAIISSMSMSQERRQKVMFTEKYYDSPSVFIVRKGSEIKGTSPEEIKGYKLGVTSSTSQASYVEKFYPGVPTTVFTASPDLYKGLADGKVDIIMEDKLAVYDWLANTKAGSCCEFKGKDLKDPVYFGEGAGIAVRPDDTKLLNVLNSALETIKTDGTYDMINAKYFPFSIL